MSPQARCDGGGLARRGDSPYDAIAAHKAGLRTFGVLTGGFTAAELRTAGATRIFRDLGALLHAYPFRAAGP